MKNQRVAKRASVLVAEFLAVLLPMLLPVFLALPALAAPATVQQLQNGVIEISGGSGAQAWTLRYASVAKMEAYEHHLVQADEHRAWFSHGGWLRLIDTDKGVVLGRWNLPGYVTELKPHDGKVTVTVSDYIGDVVDLRKTYEFDPQHPNVPLWMAGNMLTYRVAEQEPLAALKTYAVNQVRRVPTGPITPEDEKAAVPLLEEAIRRDPFAPWFRVLLGQILADQHDARAPQVLREAVELPGVDCLELFPMSAHLAWIGQPELWLAAFDRGYADYIRRGFEPRLFTLLIGRLVLLGMPLEKLPAAAVPKMQEDIYRLMPYQEGAEAAWYGYADHARQAGDTQRAEVWRQRGADARRNGTCFGYALSLAFDRWHLLAWALLAAMIFYVIVQRLRYAPQRRLDAAARSRGAGGRRFSFFGAVYWDTRERLVFLTLAVALWLATGIAGGYLSGYMRMFASPWEPWMGSFASPMSAWQFENHVGTTENFSRVVPGPATDLLRAFAYQSGGETQKAEALYRALPQYAASWNNLGVILKQAGREAEARQAFEHALQADPQLTEATYNLGRGTTSLWAEIHQQYLPGQPMLAPPPRRLIIESYNGTWGDRLPGILAGPLGGLRKWQSYVHNLTGIDHASAWLRTTIFLTVLTMLAALLILFVMPHAEVTQAAPGWLRVLELAIPGTSARYRLAGGVVLTAWCYFVLQLIGLYRLGSPYVLSFWAWPNVARAFGPSLVSQQSLREQGLVFGVPGGADTLVNPTWMWLYLPLVAIYVVNVAVVLWRRAGERAPN